MKTRHYLTVPVFVLMLAMATGPVAKAAAHFSSLAMQEPLAPTAAEREMYTRGQNLYLQGNYTQSAEVLVSFLQIYPNSIIKDLALLWLGRAYYRVGKFVEAEEVGKRLRSIKDTPFADIYDAELTTTRREAAAQVRRTNAESKASPAAPAATSRVTSPNGRSRSVEGSGEKPAASAAVNTEPNAAKRQAPVAPKPGRTRTVAGDVARQQAKSVAGKSTRPSTTNKGTARVKGGPAPLPRSSVANRSPQRSTKSAAPVRKPVAAATSQRSGQGTQGTVARPKAPSSSRNPAIGASHSAGAGGAAVRKAPQVRSLSLARVGTTSGPARRNSVGFPVESGSAQTRGRPSAEPTDSANQASSSSNARANERVATGGLYSLIEAAGETAPGRSTLPARVDARSKRITAGPGEVVYLSFVVRNPESIKRTYELRISAPGAPEARLFVDSNGDGIHQGDELPVTGAPVVELKNSEVPFLLEITIPRSAFEGQQYSYTVTVLSVGSGAVVATATSTLTVSSIRARLLPARSWAGKSALSL
ncbi:MAG: hypothetical protein ABI596_10685 [Pyrinomonadaceae bacterium]